jgi:hypothetical protein
VDPTNAPKIRKPELKVRKPRRSDMELSNLSKNQTTHFVGCIERPNTNNSSYNLKNVRTTSNVGPTICVSSVKGKHK